MIYGMQSIYDINDICKQIDISTKDEVNLGSGSRVWRREGTRKGADILVLDQNSVSQ